MLKSLLNYKSSVSYSFQNSLRNIFSLQAVTVSLKSIPFFFLLLDTAGLSHISELNSAVSVHFCDSWLQGLSFYCKLKQKPMMMCPKLLFSGGGPRWVW